MVILRGSRDFQDVSWRGPDSPQVSGHVGDPVFVSGAESMELFVVVDVAEAMDFAVLVDALDPRVRIALFGIQRREEVEESLLALRDEDSPPWCPSVAPTSFALSVFWNACRRLMRWRVGLGVRA